MAEPASSTLGISLAAGALTLTGSILGLQYDCLMAGMFGGLIALSFADPKTKSKMAVAVCSSSIMAGYTTPVLVAGLLNYIDWMSKVSEVSFKLFCAVSIGMSCHTVIPAFLSYIKKKIGSL